MSEESQAPEDRGATAAALKFHGPVFLVDQMVDNSAHYFWVDDPSKLPERAAGVRVPLDSPLVSFLTSHFRNTPVLVAPGNRFHLKVGNKVEIMWTILAAKEPGNLDRLESG